MSDLYPIYEKIRIDAYVSRRRQEIADIAGVHINTVSSFINKVNAPCIAGVHINTVSSFINKVNAPCWDTLLRIESAVKEVKERGDKYGDDA
jgi:hypothetical protein